MKDSFKKLLLSAIRLYQKTLSLDHGPLKKIFPYFGCKYHPTCSEYTYKAVKEHGVFKGAWLGSKRLLRCNPWSHGGHDPVPGKNQGVSDKN